MGVIIRGGVVVGVIFAVSPLHDRPEPVAPIVKQITAGQVADALKAADALCGSSWASCVSGAQDLIDTSRAKPATQAVSKPPDISTRQQRSKSPTAAVPR